MCFLKRQIIVDSVTTLTGGTVKFFAKRYISKLQDIVDYRIESTDQTCTSLLRDENLDLVKTKRNLKIA